MCVFEMVIAGTEYFCIKSEFIYQTILSVDAEEDIGHSQYIIIHIITMLNHESKFNITTSVRVKYVDSLCSMEGRVWCKTVHTLTHTKHTFLRFLLTRLLAALWLWLPLQTTYHVFNHTFERTKSITICTKFKWALLLPNMGTFECSVCYTNAMHIDFSMYATACIITNE